MDTETSRSKPCPTQRAWPYQNWPSSSAEMCRGFCCANFEGFCRGFSSRIYLCTFPHKNEENKSGDKIRKQIRRPKNKNPRTKSILPKPTLTNMLPRTRRLYYAFIVQEPLYRPFLMSCFLGDVQEGKRKMVH